MLLKTDKLFGSYVLKSLYVFYCAYFKPITFCLYLQDIDANLFAWNNPYMRFSKNPGYKGVKYYCGQYFWLSICIPQFFYLLVSSISLVFNHDHSFWFRCELYLLGWVLGHILSRVYRGFIGNDLFYLSIFWGLSFLVLFSLVLFTGQFSHIIMFFLYLIVGVIFGLISGLLFGLVGTLFFGIVPILGYFFFGTFYFPLLVSFFLGISVSIRFVFGFYSSVLYGFVGLLIVNCLAFQFGGKDFFLFFLLGSFIGFTRLPIWFIELCCNGLIYILISKFKFVKIMKHIWLFYDESILLPVCFVSDILYLTYIYDKEISRKLMKYLSKGMTREVFARSSILLMLNKLMLNCVTIVDINTIELDLLWFCEFLVQDRVYLRNYISLIEFTKTVYKQDSRKKKLKVMDSALEYLEKKLKKHSSDSLISVFNSEKVIQSWKRVLQNARGIFASERSSSR